MLLKDWQTSFYQELQERNLHRQQDFVNSNLEKNIISSEKFSANARMQIYAYAFWARQVESLEEDFPLLQKLLGKIQFRQLLKEYIYNYPSEHYTLAELGRRLPEFLQTQGVSAVLYDLACLEWLLFELEYAPAQEEPELHEIETLQIQLKSSVRLLSSEFSLAEIYEQKELLPSPSVVKESESTLTTTKQLTKRHFFVFVKTQDVRFFTVEKAAYEFLQRWQKGASIVEAFEQDPDLSPQKVQEYFRIFQENQLFTSDILPHTQF